MSIGARLKKLKRQKKIMKLKSKYQKLSSANRLSSLEVPIIAITGGIATGKSTVDEYLKTKGHPLISADALIKKIYQEATTFEFINRSFPQVIDTAKIDFKKLRDLFFHNEDVQKKIEEFLYPLLEIRMNDEFIALGKPDYLFYDVPLLFEKDMAKNVDVTVVVYAPENLQLERLLKRDSITPELAKQILSKQWPIEQKKNLANFVIDNQGSLNETQANINKVLDELF